MPTNKTYLTLSATLLAFYMHAATADFAADAETILNWGETTYPQFLTKPAKTQILPPWRYRFYQPGIYVGVNEQDNWVYVLSGALGPSPVKFETTGALLAKINAPSSSEACDSRQAPPGISYSMSGNTVKVTTNGQCIVVPKTPFCTPSSPTATNISALQNVVSSSTAIQGIKYNAPGLESIFDTIFNSAKDIKSCIIHAPQNYTDMKIDLDACFDMTENFKSMPPNPMITLDSKVTMTVKSNTVIQKVADCFKTDATVISNAVTNELWIKQNGTFVPVK